MVIYLPVILQNRKIVPPTVFVILPEQRVLKIWHQMKRKWPSKLVCQTSNITTRLDCCSLFDAIFYVQTVVLLGRNKEK